MTRKAVQSILGIAGVVWLASCAIVRAEGCRLTNSTSGPARQVMHCDGGPVIEAEASADVRIFDRSGQGRPDGARIDTGAALLEVPPHYPGGFQISTPRAIASVRGTVWVVDVQPQQTSVFVTRGQVTVSRETGDPGVVLNPGDGVEVGDGPGPLRVERWSPARAGALLARFGR